MRLSAVLFGDIDTRGAQAIKAFVGDDVASWHRNFQALFQFIDIQKLRTPKGIDWLTTRYPPLSQNELMMEMQGIQAMHCTIWTEGVREIVSAQEADVKFIISDHPVTIYNHAAPPDADLCAYPLDPSIALKASQTIYPLNRDFCLLLTNLEYAKDRNADPLSKRTFARNFRSSMVRTDAFIRTRRLASEEVRKINHVIKARARRYVAAGRKEWLHDELEPGNSWASLADVMRPPDSHLGRFGGEMYASFEDGSVHYQDEFGRTEPEPVHLKKVPPLEPDPRDSCGCGSGLRYRDCCKPLPVQLRPTWSERSIRERNLMLYRAIQNILDFGEGKDWLAIRRDLTDEQIKEVHVVYRALWPLETDILQLLPKPDGRQRAIYTGALHPAAVQDFALGESLYFGELMIENPFLHAGIVNREYSPIEHPRDYHQEFIKTVALFLTLMPLVETGYINLIPDPCIFDAHLRRQMMDMAQKRSVGMDYKPEKEPRLMRLMELDFKRNLMSMPPDGLKSQLRESSPELTEQQLDETIAGIQQLRELDPLASVQDGLFGGEGTTGQMTLNKLSPNFEMALYLAQATGASIVTDSPHRWEEIGIAVERQGGGFPRRVPGFGEALSEVPFAFPNDVEQFFQLASTGSFEGYPAVMSDVFNYLAARPPRNSKPNWEAHLTARFRKMHRTAQKTLRKEAASYSEGKLHALFPAGGIRDNTVNRLLLMSSSEHHLLSAPMAFFIEPATK